MGVSILAVLCAGGSLCKIGAELPHVTLVLPGKLDKHPWGEFAPGGSSDGLRDPWGRRVPPAATSPDPQCCGCAGRTCAFP